MIHLDEVVIDDNPKGKKNTKKQTTSKKQNDKYYLDIANFTGLVENPDSVGFDYKTRTWSSPTLPGYDSNQIGLGVDKQNNPYLKDSERLSTATLSEQRERAIRLATIKGLNSSYNNRINFAKNNVKDFDGNLSQHKTKLIYQALYKRPSAVAKWWNKNTAEKYINATDEEATQMIKDFHKKYFTKTYKGRNKALDRALSVK